MAVHEVERRLLRAGVVRPGLDEQDRAATGSSLARAAITRPADPAPSTRSSKSSPPCIRTTSKLTPCTRLPYDLALRPGSPLAHRAPSLRAPSDPDQPRHSMTFETVLAQARAEGRTLLNEVEAKSPAA